MYSVTRKNRHIIKRGHKLTSVLHPLPVTNSRMRRMALANGLNCFEYVEVPESVLEFSNQGAMQIFTNLWYVADGADGELR